MSAALFYLSNFYIGLFVWTPCGETLPQGFLHIRTGGLYTRRVRGLSEAAHHCQIAAGIARAEVEPLREVEPEPVVLEPETRIERL